MGHLIRGDNTTFPGFSLLGESSVAITLDDTGTDGLTLDFVVLSGTTSVSIASKGAPGGFTVLYQLVEKNNDLTTVTITGSEHLFLGASAGGGNTGDAFVTDIAATAKSPTTIHSSLTLIDASETTGGISIYAGATNTSSAGTFQNGGTLNANVTITYTGLEIKGGFGNDYIENDAKNGIVIDRNGSDVVDLGGAGAKATMGKGAIDLCTVGFSGIGTTETAGSCLGDTVKFGSAATAVLEVLVGAEAGSTASTTNIGLTKVLDAADGLRINFTGITVSGTVADETAAVASAKNLTAAEDDAVAALAGPGVAYFTYKGSEYFIAANHTETEISSSDAIVKLVGVTDLTATNSAGVVTLHHVG